MRHRPVPVLTLLVSALSLAAWSSTALADAKDATRVSLHLALGVGGEYAIVPEAGRVLEADLDPTLGFGARLEVPIHDYVVIGGMFELGGLKVDDVERDADLLLDFDLWVKGRYFSELAGDAGLEIYVGLPIGFTLFRFDDEDADNQAGFNVGVLAGAVLFFDQLGFFTEVGWRRHQFRDEVDLGFLGREDVKVRMNQAALSFGAVLAF